MITLILIIDANRNILIRYYFCAWFSINLNGKKKFSNTIKKKQSKKNNWLTQEIQNINNPTTVSQKVVNRKLGRTTVYDLRLFHKTYRIPTYDIFRSQITDWVGAVVNLKS